MEVSKLDKEKPQSHGNIKLRRILYLIYGVFFINFAFLTWAIVGYLDLFALVLIWILLVFSFIFIFYSVYSGEDFKYAKYLTTAAFIISFILFADTILRLAPAYGTDEIAIDTYSGYLFIHGKDPYINSNMLNVFAFTGLPKSLITPLLTGGAVEYLVYPGLSVLLFIPALLLNIPTFSVLLVFNILAVVIAYLYYQKTGFEVATIALIAAMLIDMEYAFFSVDGVTDIVWVAFVSASYIFRKRPWLSGLLFGLAVSFKQTPLAMLPFFLFFLYNENDRRKSSVLEFIAIGSLSFILTNIPFILMQPYDWLTNIVEIAFQPIIGVGLGPSVTSFAGFISIPSDVFTIISIAVLFCFLVVYIEKYNNLKFAFFTFPVVVFLFNYRVLENYIVYWPFLFFIVLPDLWKEKRLKENFETSERHPILSRLTGGRKFAAALIVILIAGGAAASAGFVITHSIPQSPFEITNITSASDPLDIPNSITKMIVSLNYTPLENEADHQNVLFRIFPNSGLENVNSLLWYSNSSLVPGLNNVSIYPDAAADFLNESYTFKLEAYYGNFTSFFSLKKPLSINDSLPMEDPTLIYPTYQSNEPYDGWYYSMTGPGKYDYRYLMTGINETVYVDPGQKMNSSYLYLRSAINFTYLADSNYIFSFNYSGSNSEIQNTTYQNFTFKTFSGVVFSFDSGLEQLWLGFNKSVSGSYFDFVNADRMLIVTSQTTINFKTIMEYLNKYQWSYDDSMFSFVLGAKDGNQTLSAEFYNVSLFQSSTPSTVYQNFSNYSLDAFKHSSFLEEDTRW